MLAAFNYARDMHDVAHRLKGLKKPPSRPRLHSFTAEDETAIYDATDEAFGDFLFVAIHTGLRPFCELARLTADDIVEAGRGNDVAGVLFKDEKDSKDPGSSRCGSSQPVAHPVSASGIGKFRSSAIRRAIPGRK